jgi:glycosyltransferase involved in cell wall biosynthesis
MSDLPSVTFLLQDVPALYGAERVTLELMVALQARGLQVETLLMGETRLGPGSDAFARAAREAGLPVQRFEVEGRFSTALVKEIRRHLKARPSAILHTVGYKAHLHALLAARGRAPAVTTMHGWLVRPELKERLYEWLEVQLLRRDQAVICLTRYYEELLLQKGVKRERVHRIPTGLAPAQVPSFALAASWPEGPFTVALVGRLSWEKNHDVFLRALARLQAAGLEIQAVLAGEGPERAWVEMRVKELGLQDRVRLAGYVAMVDLLPQVHAVCLTSRIENLPLSLIEAMAWQRPVVATRVGGIPDVVEDEVTGLLVPDDDEQALADALGRLQADPARARVMGQAGRLRVEQEFTMARCVDRHMELYTQLQKRPR